MQRPIKKTFLTAASSLLIATNLYANGAPQMPVEQPAPVPVCMGCGCPDAIPFFKTGFYGGAQLGYEYMNTKLKSRFDNGSGATYRHSGTEETSGLLAEVYAGGRYLYSNCMMLGLELGGVFNTNAAKKTLSYPNEPASFKLRSKRLYGIIPSFVVGKVFQERFMVYGKAGIAISGFESEITDRSANRKFSKDKTLVGFAPSIGLEYAVTTSASARFELGGEFYGSSSKTAPINITNGNITRIGSDKFEAKSNMFTAKVGVVVKI